MHCKKCWSGLTKTTKRNADLEGYVVAEDEETGIIRKKKRRGIRKKRSCKCTK
jgi:hypothetical protein